ncbi:MAG: hypothetical protein U1F52_06400 [Burkholderiales bacterium]
MDIEIPGTARCRSGFRATVLRLTLMGLVAFGSASGADADERGASPAAAGAGTGTAAATLSVTPNTLSIVVGNRATATIAGASGSLSLSVSDRSVVQASVGGSVITVTGLKAGNATVTLRDSRTSRTVAVVVTRTTATTDRYSLLAWNDLGMHCVDGKDYSILSILPPYNNLHAQLVNARTGKAVTTGVTLTYEAVADPQGSVNSISSTKTNFWVYVKSLFGTDPGADIGLAGNPTAGFTPAPLKYNATQKWFEAEGIPITPYDDRRQKNFYPLVKVVAKDASGKVLATAQAVLPVSDEMTCRGCHASVTTGNGAQLAAKPRAGWVADPDPEKDWKRNILRLHDERRLTTSKPFIAALTQLGYDKRGLETTASLGKPILCASCHASNALPGTGVAGIAPLTSAMHAKHATVVDPVQLVKLDDIGNRSSCYLCHPGSVTKCLRGAMGNAADASGNALMGCQSCHGNMAAVGNPARVGWLEQPTCQACHHDGQRDLTALDATGKLKKPADTRFATNPDKPAAGFSLFRFSAGHGGLQCEACHGATHAEYPSSHENDNLLSIALQGHAGTVAECTVCHATVPGTANGGPHGMHATTSWWVGAHGDRVESSGAQVCATCHGADYRGSPLSRVSASRSFNADGRRRTYAPGQAVGCYDCHNGPRGD